MIFLVTQDQGFLESMVRRLREMGKPAMGFSQTDTLWTHLRHTTPDIIILDWYSPHIHALEIMKGLLSAQYKGKIIVLGGESTAPLVPEASQLGAIQVAGRPLAISRVLGAIRIAQEHLQDDWSHSSANRLDNARDRGYEVLYS